MLIGGLIGRLDDATIANGIEIARAAGEIGGYGLIKDAAVERYHAQLKSLLHAFDKAAAQPRARAACSESNAASVPRPRPLERKRVVEGKSGSVRVGPGGRRVITKK